MESIAKCSIKFFLFFFLFVCVNNICFGQSDTLTSIRSKSYTAQRRVANQNESAVEDSIIILDERKKAETNTLVENKSTPLSEKKKPKGKNGKK